MPTTNRSPGILGRRLRAFSAMTLIGMFGCGSRDRNEPVAQSDQPETRYQVRIDAGNNGAAPSPAQSVHDDESVSPRSLVFETSGVAPIPDDGGTQEQWASAREAAVLDALAKAIMESRRSSELPYENFVEKMAPKLTIAHRITDEGEEFEVRLLDRGMERMFLIRDGVLQHPPHDFDLVRKVFRETRGAFALLPADQAPLSRYVARVGCYELADRGPAYAGDIDSERSTPADDTMDATTP